MERHVPRGGGNGLKPSHNHGLWQVGVFNNLALWGEKKFVGELKRTYKFQRGVNNILDCHANQTRILSKEYSFVAGDYVRSTARNDVKCHTEDNSPKYRIVGKMKRNSFTDKVHSLFTTPHSLIHTDMDFSLKRAAFTLAEVLITLGIIGVVAAMTIGVLVQNYQKQVVLNKLKQSYSQINTGMQYVANTEFEGRGIGDWTCPDQEYNVANQTLCFYKVIEHITPGAKIFTPTDFEHVACASQGDYKQYTNNWGNIREGRYLSNASFSAYLPNGACVIWNWKGWAGDGRGNLFIDVDGPYKGPNKEGKDLFVFQYIYANLGGQIKDGISIYPKGYNNGEAPSSRSALVQGCKKGGSTHMCAALIMYDGWQIAKDYPW